MTVNGEQVPVAAEGLFHGQVDLAEGGNTIAVRAENDSGKVTEVKKHVTKDTVAPVITITAPAENHITRQQQVTITGSVSEAGAVVTLKEDPVPVGPDKTFSTTIVISEGVNELSVRATDPAGNSVQKRITVTGDFQQPTVALTVTGARSTAVEPGDTIQVNQSDITLTGEVDNEPAGITAAINQQEIPTREITNANENTLLVFENAFVLTQRTTAFLVQVTDQAGNRSKTWVWVSRPEISGPAVSVSYPPNNCVTDSSSVYVSGTVNDSTESVLVTVNNELVTLSANGTFGHRVSLFPEYNYISVQAVNADGEKSSRSVKVYKDYITELPPNPEDVAPELDSTVVTTLDEATAFLYNGDRPIQRGVQAGTIDPKRAAVIRGTIRDKAGNPLPGVLVTVLDHPEYGYTLSREDGAFDMAVNGGGSLTVNYKKDGYLHVQRQVDLPWQDYAVAETINMIPVDPQVTTVDFSDPVEVARGTTQSDADGARQATLMFEKGTRATMVLPDGSTRPLTSINVRATEYTVGENGPEAMPAELPPTSGYTYAAEFSVDQALQAGATEVRFDKPVATYVENFIGFPVGSIVPSGYYDREKAMWVPSENGRVIEITAVNRGLANIDISGDGAAEPADSLLALGITRAERQKLATLYTPGQSLWRVAVKHFTPYDYNWPPSIPRDAEPPDLKLEKPTLPDNDKSDKCRGSIIAVQNQTLGEAVDITGAPCGLYYQSANSEGFKADHILPIPLSGASVPRSLKRIDLIVTVAGKRIKKSFDGQANQSYTFRWDGKDVFGRSVQGEQSVSVRVGYVYDNVFYFPATLGNAFGNVGTEPIAFVNRQGIESVLWQYWNTTLGHFTWNDFGGWHPGIHHQYDFKHGTLYKGNGAIRKVENKNNTVRAIYKADDLEATFEEGDSRYLRKADMGPDGSVYFSLYKAGKEKIIRRYPDGTIETLYENEICLGLEFVNPSFATANIHGIPCLVVTSIDVNSYGEVYVGSSPYPAVSVVIKIDKNGTPQIVADEHSTFNGLTDFNSIPYIVDIAAAKDGSIYLAHAAQITKVGADGSIRRIAGSGDPVSLGDGGPALEADFNQIKSIDIGPDGSLYVLTSIFSRRISKVRKITPDGIITTVAGTFRNIAGAPFPDDKGSGGKAKAAILFSPYDIAVGQDGSFYITEGSYYSVEGGVNQIRKVTPDGIIYHVAGLRDDNTGGFNFNNAPASATRLQNPQAIMFGPDGNLYFSDGYGLRMIEILSNHTSQDKITVASTDGSQLYIFDSTGKHLRTQDALTGQTLYEFAYNSAGLLSKIVDFDGLETTIERDAGGTVTAIIAPFGQRTELNIGADGYLSAITNPAGETTTFSYTKDGLLTGVTDPKGNHNRYGYDGLGYLVSADHPNGGSKELTRVETDDGFRVTMTTAEGNVTQYQVDRTPDGAQTFTTTDAHGLQTVKRHGSDGSVTVTAPDGTTTYTRRKPDPRFGMQVPLIDSMAVQTPAGLVSNMSQSRTITQYTGDKVTGLTDSVTTNGKVSVSQYDGNRRLTTTTSPEGRQSFSYNDSLGRVIKSSVPGIAATNYTYNRLGQLTETAQGGRATRYTYDDRGRVASVTDPLGRMETTEYDSVGRVTTQILPNGEQIGYDYDKNGNLKSITPPGQPAHTFSYTTVDQTDNYAPPAVPDSAGDISYVYDKDKKLLQTVFADSSAIRMVYDTTGGGSARPMAITYDQGRTSFAYDSATGNLASVVSSDSVTTTYRYDGSLRTRQTTSGVVNGAIAYSYDNDFQVTAQTINGAHAVGFRYDDDGLLVGAGALSMSYDPQNGLLNSTSMGTISGSYAYNGFGELSETTAAYNGADLYHRTYTRDALGRITGLTETIGGQTDTYAYTYNDIGYLVEVTKNGAIQAEYQYDANGNRTAYSGAGSTVTATYDAQDRMLTYGDARYGYGPRGDLQRKIEGADTTRYDYGNQGNLRSVVLPDGKVIEYVIDGQNRRVAKKVNGKVTKRWLYAGGLLPIAELGAAGTVKKRYGPGYIVKNDTTYRVLRDHLGSVRMIVNSQTGQVVQRIDYDGWGNIVNLQNPDEFTDIGFAGGLYDKDTGLVRFGARDYDPEVGRWTSKDPILFAGGTSNLYEYALNDPVNNIDPDGLQALAIRDFAAGLSSTLSFGLSDLILDALGDAGRRNKCSDAYSAGEWTGAIADVALGGKGILKSLARSLSD